MTIQEIYEHCKTGGRILYIIPKLVLRDNEVQDSYTGIRLYRQDNVWVVEEKQGDGILIIAEELDEWAAIHQFLNAIFNWHLKDEFASCQ